jgi:sialidase-1
MIPALLAAAVISSQDIAVPVFTPSEPGSEPRYGYRIPSIVESKSGALLAFCERRIGFHDHAQNDIVLRRSIDGGATWLETQVLADDGGDSLNDPCAVVLDSGRIILRYKRYPEGVHQRRSSHTVMAEPGYGGPKNVRVYLIHSDDDGETWSERRDVTRIMRRETSISVGSPGGAIQIQNGRYKGRVVFPNYEGIRLSETERTFQNSALYSDDGGENWTLSAPIDTTSISPAIGNEAQIVELPDGSILMSARIFGGVAGRIFSRSTDGGATWKETRVYSEMETPACMSSLISYKTPEGSLLLHSVPNTKNSRSKGAIFSSFDLGRTWKKLIEIEPNEFAYSQLLNLRGGDVGCLYETGAGEDFRIVFKRIPSEMLRQIQ